MKRTLWALTLCLVLSGCVTTQEVSVKANSWIGASEDSLVEKWGPPISEYNRKGGRKILTYRDGYSRIVSTPTDYSKPNGHQKITTDSASCLVNFYIDDGMNVSKVDWKGTVGYCNDFIPRRPGTIRVNHRGSDDSTTTLSTEPPVEDFSFDSEPAKSPVSKEKK